MFGHLFRKNYADFQEVPQEEGLDELQDAPRQGSLSWQLYLYILVAPILAFVLGASYQFFPSYIKNQCLQQVSQYSPVASELGLSYHQVDFEGSLLHENIYRQNASDEVDAAWVALGVDYRAAIVPAEQAEKSGLTPLHVQLSKKYGGGFPANVEGLHHLHCLNLLRQSLYYNYEYYYSRKQGAFVNDDRILRFHVSHCLDILRQQLMCTVDIGVLGQVWYNKASPHAFPDFNTRHTCRDFEGVRRWAESHQALAHVPEDYLDRPPVDSENVYDDMP